MEIALGFICWWLSGFIPMAYYITERQDINLDADFVALCAFCLLGPIAGSIAVIAMAVEGDILLISKRR